MRPSHVRILVPASLLLLACYGAIVRATENSVEEEVDAEARGLLTEHQEHIDYLSHAVDGDDDVDAVDDDSRIFGDEPFGLDEEYGDLAAQAIPTDGKWNVPAVVVMLTMDGALHALDTRTGVLLWSFSTGGKTISSSAPFHGDMLFLSSIDGAGLMAYKPGMGVASIPKHIFHQSKPFHIKQGPDEVPDRCITSKITKLFRVKVATGEASSTRVAGLKEQCDMTGEPLLFVARTDFSISCVDGVYGQERWNYRMAEFDLSMSHNNPGSVLDPERGLGFAMDPGEHSSLLQAIDTDTGLVRWNFNAPKPLMPATVHTVSTAGSLHLAEIRELSQTGGAVVEYQTPEPTILIREWDRELYVLGTHNGELFGSLDQLYESFSRAPKMTKRQMGQVRSAASKEMVVPWTQLDQCSGLGSLNDAGDLADELSILHRDCLVGNYPLQVEALARLPAEQSYIDAPVPDQPNGFPFSISAYRYEIVGLGVMLAAFLLLLKKLWRKWKAGGEGKKSRRKRTRVRRGSADRQQGLRETAETEAAPRPQNPQQAPAEAERSASAGSEKEEGERLLVGNKLKSTSDGVSTDGVGNGGDLLQARRGSADETNLTPKLTVDLLELLEQAHPGDPNNSDIVHQLQQRGADSPDSIPRLSVQSRDTGSPLMSSLSSISSKSPILAGLSVLKPSRYAQEYQELELLGKGSFGSVHKVRNMVDQNEYAIKKVSIPHEKIETVLDEVRIISRLDHPNVRARVKASGGG
eukprot:TRINITY_DN15549_c0_g1_i3.p1 TRINITY_DN15549_c0_g1~~TRINITY_DN15549_c0_g1_i3.p1  ORF type:complete len:750 (-),score=193.86 TRINITY_DN15549_c0_g1_i3:216-2465(-)